MNNYAQGAVKSILLSVAILPVSIAHAALDVFSPYAFVGVLKDSNIFRADNNTENDTVAHFGAGVNADLKLSRQHLLLDAVVDRAEYDSFSELDNTRVNAKTVWAWQLGNLWSGELGYRYKRELSSFNQQFVRQKDMRTTNSVDLEAGYQVHPDWRLVGGLGFSDIAYQERKRLERETRFGQLEVQYNNTLNTKVGLRGTYTENDLQNRVDVGGIQINNDYDETELSGVFYWEGSGKSALEARLGYTDLNAQQRNERDYQGVSGWLTYYGILTGKTRVNVSVWRETSSLSNEITSYVLTKGVEVKPEWSATRKISVEGEVSFTNDDFKGDNDIRAALGQERRDDDTWIYAIRANWDPRRNLRFSLGYRREERDSSVSNRDFDDNQVEARVRLSL